VASSPLYFLTATIVHRLHHCFGAILRSCPATDYQSAIFLVVLQPRFEISPINGRTMSETAHSRAGEADRQPGLARFRLVFGAARASAELQPYARGPFGRLRGYRLASNWPSPRPSTSYHLVPLFSFFASVVIDWPRFFCQPCSLPRAHLRFFHPRSFEWWSDVVALCYRQRTPQMLAATACQASISAGSADMPTCVLHLPALTLGLWYEDILQCVLGDQENCMIFRPMVCLPGS